MRSMSFQLGTPKVSDSYKGKAEEVEGQQLAQILEQILRGKYGLITTLRNVLAQESSHPSHRHAQQTSCRALLKQILRVCVVLYSAGQINLSVVR